MNKTLGIIGAGDLGMQIAHYAIHDKHFDNILFFDDFNANKNFHNYPIFGKLDSIQSAYDANLFDELIIAIGYSHLKFKEEIFLKYKDKIPFAQIIHSSSYVDKSVKIGQGTIIFPNCCIDLLAEIGENNVINIGCSIAHNSIIKNHCFISPSVAIAGFVEISDRCIVGINTTIIDNIKITSDVQSGGGSVIIKNIENSGLYVGNPVRQIR